MPYYLVGKGHRIVNKSVSWELSSEYMNSVTSSGGIEITGIRWEHKTDAFQAYKL